MSTNFGWLTTTNEPEHIREIFNKVHYVWLRENLQELEVDSSHINIENLREFAVETLFKNGFIYQYNLSPEKCLSPVKSDHSELRDFAEETLSKNGPDTIFKDPETICELKDFAADTLKKTALKQISSRTP